MGDVEQEPVSARIVNAIASLDAAAWDACAGTQNPFVGHAFLKALEESGSVRPETGWAPQHLALEDADGRLLGVAPLYLKSHSQGEYVFDYGWADAFERAGGEYYPKLLMAVPFTPVPGPRLLAPSGPDQSAVRDTLLAAAVQIARQHEISSLHVNFCSRDEWLRGGELGMLQRTGEQFHWLNRGYGTFADFLADLAARKRKTIAKERRQALGEGLELVVLQGADIGEEHWDAFFHFYMDTGSRKWGRPYLNREFFSLLGQAMAERIALFLVRRNRRWIAGALNLIGSDCLYGRYWGCTEEHRFLHFEVCYYRAIEFAIDHGLARVEAGAQGPHKLARGYVPVHTYSAHWIRDGGFRAAVENYLEHERREIDQEIEHLGRRAPFRQTQGDG
jgi:hypothetical protein